MRVRLDAAARRAALQAARLIIGPMAGARALETVTGGFYGLNPYKALSNANSYPGFMLQPVAVVNDGRRRIFLHVNDGYNPMDSAAYSPYASYPNTVTINIAAWAVPATSTLVHNIVSQGSMGEVLLLPF